MRQQEPVKSSDCNRRGHLIQAALHQPKHRPPDNGCCEPASCQLHVWALGVELVEQVNGLVCWRGLVLFSKPAANYRSGKGWQFHCALLQWQGQYSSCFQVRARPAAVLLNMPGVIYQGAAGFLLLPSREEQFLLDHCKYIKLSVGLLSLGTHSPHGSELGTVA